MPQSTSIPVQTETQERRTKEQQIRRFAECQHSNDSEKHKTKQLTTQGNKCSCGKNHTLMPISLIALWFRQRAERQGVWALCAAVLQPGCHLGGWILALPLAIFAFSFATLQGQTESSFSWGCQTPAGACAAGWRISPHVCTHVQRTGLFPCVFLLSHLILCPEFGDVWRSPALVFRDFPQCAQSKPQVLWCFFIGGWDFGGLNLRAKRSKQKNRLNGSKWLSHSNREQKIISSTSLPGRFMREGEQRFPWRKDKEADYDILYFIVLPEMELRALFSALIYCVKH